MAGTGQGRPCLNVGPNCPVCGGISSDMLDLSPSPISAQGFFEYPTDAVLDNLWVSECVSCKHVFLDCTPVDYYRSVVRSTSVSQRMKGFRRLQAENLKDLIIPSLADSPKVFEIGAHKGENLDIFKEVGFDTFGCEFLTGSGEPKSQSHCIWDTSIDGRQLSPELPAANFDAVISFNFLEHFKSPLSGLKKAFELLKPGGLGLIEVPNFDYISSTGLISEFIVDHLHYFSRKSLSRMFTEAGFGIYSIDSIWDNYILSAVIERPVDVQWENFVTGRSRLIAELIELTKYAANAQKKIYLWGCGHQSMFMLVHLGVEHCFDAIIDSSVSKIGKYPVGLRLEVHPPAYLKSKASAVILVCAGGFNSEIKDSIKNFDTSHDVFEVASGAIKRV